MLPRAQVETTRKLYASGKPPVKLEQHIFAELLGDDWAEGLSEVSLVGYKDLIEVDEYHDVSANGGDHLLSQRSFHKLECCAAAVAAGIGEDWTRGHGERHLQFKSARTMPADHIEQSKQRVLLHHLQRFRCSPCPSGLHAFHPR